MKISRSRSPWPLPSQLWGLILRPRVTWHLSSTQHRLCLSPDLAASQAALPQPLFRFVLISPPSKWLCALELRLKTSSNFILSCDFSCYLYADGFSFHICGSDLFLELQTYISNYLFNTSNCMTNKHFELNIANFKFLEMLDSYKGKLRLASDRHVHIDIVNSSSKRDHSNTVFLQQPSFPVQNLGVLLDSSFFFKFLILSLMTSTPLIATFTTI